MIKKEARRAMVSKRASVLKDKDSIPDYDMVRDDYEKWDQSLRGVSVLIGFSMLLYVVATEAWRFLA